MVKLDQLELSLLIDGKPVNEYTDDEVDAAEEARRQKVTRYVEVEEGALFSLKLWVKRKFKFGKADYLTWHIYIDGDHKVGMVIEKCEHHEPGPTYSELSSYDAADPDGIWRTDFQFGKISMRETKEDDDVDALKEQHKDVGTIYINVQRMKGGRSIPFGPSRMARSTSTIAHKVFKGDARTVSTSFKRGLRVKDVGNMVKDLQYVDSGPVATFIFKYRTRDALEKLRVIRRPATPESLEERPVESLTKEESAMLIARLQAQVEASKVKIKQERQERNLQELQLFKRTREEADSDDDIEEIASRPAKRRGPDPDSVVINLSD